VSCPADIVEDKALLDEWQTKLVDLSEEADKTANAMNTANLQRQQLAGAPQLVRRGLPTPARPF
jgi:hypothetical protein